MTDTCKLSGLEGKFVRSHLYPRSFYKQPDENVPLMMFNGRADRRFKKSRTGLYDDQLVIQETEKRFATYDDYAQKLLQPFEPLDTLAKRCSKVHRTPDRTIVGCEVAEFDFEKLFLFFCSVVWRFAASTREEAETVTLGPHFDALSEVVANEDISAGPQFGAVVCKLSDGDDMPILTPAEFRLEDVNSFEMILGGFSVYFKCDKRRFPSPFNDLELKQDGPLLLVVRDFKSSRSYANIARAGKRMFQKFGQPWPHLRRD